MPTKSILVDFLKCVADEYNKLSEMNIIDLEPRVKKIKPSVSLKSKPNTSKSKNKGRKKSRKKRSNKKTSIKRTRKKTAKKKNTRKPRKSGNSKRKKELLAQIDKLQKKLNRIHSKKHSERIKRLNGILAQLKKKLKNL
jgi:hypothetical protein